MTNFYRVWPERTMPTIISFLLFRVVLRNSNPLLPSAPPALFIPFFRTLFIVSSMYRKTMNFSYISSPLDFFLLYSRPMMIGGILPSLICLLYLFPNHQVFLRILICIYTRSPTPQSSSSKPVGKEGCVTTATIGRHWQYLL